MIKYHMDASITDTLTKSRNKILADGKSIISDEIDALLALKNNLDDNFIAACKLIANTKNKVIISGVGKSGAIARKIAATMVSLGTYATFLNPNEALHGDLGIVQADDLIILISASGNSSEIIKIIPYLQRLNIPIIAITNNLQSKLAQVANVVLNLHCKQEACFLKLAPTSSTTNTLVLGDALALIVAKLKNFSERDFAANHPGGALGYQLVTVAEIMAPIDAQYYATPNALLPEVLLKITQNNLGIIVITADDNKICGVFTDGDLRRAINQRYDLNHTSIREVMTTACVTITPEKMASAALTLMRDRKITALPVVDDQQQCIGIISLHMILTQAII